MGYPQKRGQYAPPPDHAAQIKALDKRIAKVDFEKANASTAGGLATAMNAVQAQADALQAALADLTKRVAALEKRK